MRKLLILLVVGLFATSTAMAYDEVGDAGALPGTAQGTPPGLLTNIQGVTSSTDADFVDAYLIKVIDPVTFQATTNTNRDATAYGFDTRLYIGTVDGMMNFGNDDDPIGTLQSVIQDVPTWTLNGYTTKDNPVPLIAGETYVLYVTGYSNDPYNLPYPGGTPIITINFDYDYLSGPVNNLPLTNWEEELPGDFCSSGGYNVVLTGCEGMGATPPALLVDNPIIDSTQQSVHTFSLDAGVGNAGDTYLLLGSVTGTSPGFALPGGLIMPLNWIRTPTSYSRSSTPSFITTSWATWTPTVREQLYSTRSQLSARPTSVWYRSMPSAQASLLTSCPTLCLSQSSS
jgi:hypothetical protein